VDTAGIQHGAKGFDCIGPVARTTADVASPTAIMQGHDPEKYFPLLRPWDGLRLGFTDLSPWRVPKEVIEHVDGFLEEQDFAMFEAAKRIESLGGKVVTSIPLLAWKDIVGAMPDMKEMEELFRASVSTLKCCHGH